MLFFSKVNVCKHVLLLKKVHRSVQSVLFLFFFSLILVKTWFKYLDRVYFSLGIRIGLAGVVVAAVKVKEAFI